MKSNFSSLEGSDFRKRKNVKQIEVYKTHYQYNIMYILLLTI